MKMSDEMTCVFLPWGAASSLAFSLISPFSLYANQVSMTETDIMFFLGRRLPWAVILEEEVDK
jgi:hypothetical protein